MQTALYPLPINLKNYMISIPPK